MGRAKPVERRQDDFRSGIERVEERTIKMHIVVSPSPGGLERNPACFAASRCTTASRDLVTYYLQIYGTSRLVPDHEFRGK